MANIIKADNLSEFWQNLKKPRTVYQDQEILIVWKPPGLHTTPQKNSRQETLVDWALAEFADLTGVKGRRPLEHGLLHRLDRATRGLVVFARVQKAFDFMLNEQKKDLIAKGYQAICKNQTQRLSSAPRLIKSRFRSFGPKGGQVKPLTVTCKEKSRKTASPVYKSLIVDLEPLPQNPPVDTAPLIKVSLVINRGFRHQIRAHLAWRGLPIKGDRLYDSRFQDTDGDLRLFANRLLFRHPATRQPLTITLT